jgi:hypothetical protein
MISPSQSPLEYAETLYKAGYRASNSEDSKAIIEVLNDYYVFLNYNYSTNHGYALEVLSELEEIEHKQKMEGK